MKNNVVIIGRGGIAKHLSCSLESKGISVSFFVRNHMRPSFEMQLKEEKPEAVFLAISTLDKGEAARDYILACVKAGIPVITCEKGALAYHAEVLKPHLDKIGWSAAVGGGTRMLKYVIERHLANKQVEINAVLNGTLNFIFDEMRHGRRSFNDICTEVYELGYAEPGAIDTLSLINGELVDVRMKTCVFFNTVLATQKTITPDEFGLLQLTYDELNILAEEGGDYRLVVTFTNKKSTDVYHRFGKESALYHIDDWSITLTFRQITRVSRLSSWLPGGVGNAVHIIEGELGSGGEYTLSGPGAGYEPTTSSMLTDYEELCT